MNVPFIAKWIEVVKRERINNPNPCSYCSLKDSDCQYCPEAEHIQNIVKDELDE